MLLAHLAGFGRSLICPLAPVVARGAPVALFQAAARSLMSVMARAPVGRVRCQQQRGPDCAGRPEPKTRALYQSPQNLVFSTNALYVFLVNALGLIILLFYRLFWPSTGKQIYCTRRPYCTSVLKIDTQIPGEIALFSMDYNSVLLIAANYR